MTTEWFRIGAQRKPLTPLVIHRLKIMNRSRLCVFTQHIRITTLLFAECIRCCRHCGASSVIFIVLRDLAFAKERRLLASNLMIQYFIPFVCTLFTNVEEEIKTEANKAQRRDIMKATNGFAFARIWLRTNTPTEYTLHTYDK